MDALSIDLKMYYKELHLQKLISPFISLPVNDYSSVQSNEVMNLKHIE